MAGGTGLVKKVIRTLPNPGASGDGSGEVVSFEYHVIYSMSYEVPVLYFKAVSLDGSYLAIEKIWSNIPQCISQHSHQEKVTYRQFGDEHPFLGLPFFHVHPCHTADLLKQVTSDSHSHLLTWISTVAPLVGLVIDPAYAMHINK